MAHGYMRDFDEDRGDERERSRDESRGRNERNLNFMLGDRNRDWERAPRGFRSRQDDHYLSWRDKQMQALDRDYADYCREREQQFHSDFDTWRNQRRENQPPLQVGMTQTSQSGDPTGELELTDEMSDPRARQPDPMADATLGTTSSRKR
jgi:hypothetical protein